MSVVDLEGRPVTATSLESSPASVLREVLEIIESGRMVPEKLLVIIQRPYVGGTVTHPTWDSGITAAEAVYLLETVKFDLMQAMRKLP